MQEGLNGVFVYQCELDLFFLDTASKVLLQSVGPGRRLNIVKGSATRAGGAVVGCLSNRYTVRGGSNYKLLM